MSLAGEIAVERHPEPEGTADELRLVAAARAGDHAAFDLLVARHSPRVASAARRFVEDPNDLDDVVQDTFLRAYQNLARFRGKSALRTWLIQIALNVCRDRRRGFWRRVLLARHPLELERPPSDGDGHDGALLRRTVESAVAELPEKLRLPLVLHAFEELSGAEIAEVLGWNESTVWTRIYTARKQLRARLGDICDR